MTKTEKYIIEAIKKEAKNFKQTSIRDCEFDMTINVGEAVTEVAQALRAQSEANAATANAIKALCLNMGDVKAINIEG